MTKETANSIKDEKISLPDGTGERPQRKIWRHASNWWAVLSKEDDTIIFRLGESQWERATLVFAKANTKADVAVSGDHLFVIGNRTDEKGGEEILFQHLQYSSSSRKYELLLTSPVSLAKEGPPATSSIAVDGRHTAWVTYVSEGWVYACSSAPPYDGEWNYEKLNARKLKSEDISAAGKLSNGDILLLWTDQKARSFSSRVFSICSGSWGEVETFSVGTPVADNHLSGVFSADGQAFFAVKTSLNDRDIEGLREPQIAILNRSSFGEWEFYPVSDSGTRAALCLLESESHSALVVVYNLRNDIVAKIADCRRPHFWRQSELIMKQTSNLRWNNPTLPDRFYENGIVVSACNRRGKTVRTARIRFVQEDGALKGPLRGTL